MKFYSKSAIPRPRVEDETLSIKSDVKSDHQSGTKLHRHQSMKFYITAAIPYVNAAPHIGHAQEFVIGDTIARYYKNKGDSVAYLSGADENALKIVQAAEKEGKTPQELTNLYSKRFQELAEHLYIDFDYFQRGSDQKHHFPSSQKLWQLCSKSGDIYKKTYQGLYCVGCEAFYTKEELTKDGLCPEHLKKPELIEEENYFFRLSKYQNQLLEIINANTLEIIPNFRRNEVISFIKRGLDDFSISRSKKRAKNWGVPVPNDPNQIIYVWFDALNIYQSGVGFGWDEASYNKWWPANVHLIGKGITRFHAIYWPAILLSAKLKLPKKIVVHGYITVEGQKMSKTLGNVIDPFEIIKNYGANALRYYLLKEIPTFSDGDYSQNRFKEVYNSDLANNLGNLVARIARLSDKALFTSSVNDNYISVLEKNSDYDKAIKNFRLNDALTLVWQKITNLNQYIDENKPWAKKEQELENVLKHCSDKIIEIAYLLKPFIPQTSETILKQFSGKVKSQPPLFPRIN